MSWRRAIAADLLGGIDEAAVRRDVSQGDQLCARRDHRLHRGDVDLARRRRWATKSISTPSPFRALKHGEHVRHVFRRVRQDPVARREGHSVEGHVPGAGRVLDEGDFLRGGADQRRRLGVERRQILRRRLLRGIAADAPFEVQMPQHRLVHRLRRRRRAGVVGVDVTAAGRRVRPQHLDVHATTWSGRWRAISSRCTCPVPQQPPQMSMCG